MNLVVTLDFRFARTPDGQVWTRTTYPYAFWERYLRIFDEVKIVARAEPRISVDEQYQRVTGRTVHFHAVPYYLGPWQYLKVRKQVREAVRSAMGATDAILCRVGSRLADDIVPLLWRTRRPYGLEVVGDPHEAFAPGAIKHPLRPYLRRQATQSLKEQCARAAAVSYVTERTLQRRYPSLGGFVTGVSDIDLPASWFRDSPRVFRHLDQNRRPQLLFIGSLEQMYKGQDVLLHAVAQVRRKVPVELRIVGTGRHRQELEAMASSMSLQDCVHFTGELSSAAIQDELDAASLLVLPSRTEGLPRVVVEAMTRALPCIATNVGGIPELLDDEDLVAPGNANVLAAKIAEALGDATRLTRMSSRNLEKAQQFRPEVLEQRRTAFYRFLKDATETWLRTHTRATARVA